MVAWGKTSPCLNQACSSKLPNGADGPDGRNGDQPIGTLVEGNVVQEVGNYERQGLMWNQALTAKTTLKNNIFFGCDRASISINDGFGGGNVLSGNLVFNTGRGSNKDEVRCAFFRQAFTLEECHWFPHLLA
jgi:parallel beta-helix repeat protein